MALLWQPVVAVYSPWVQPLVSPEGSSAVPWVEADDTVAVEIVSSFRKTVHFIYQQMNSELSTAWLFGNWSFVCGQFALSCSLTDHSIGHHLEM